MLTLCSEKKSRPTAKPTRGAGLRKSYICSAYALLILIGKSTRTRGSRARAGAGEA
jgi:hypothetical protein